MREDDIEGAMKAGTWGTLGIKNRSEVKIEKKKKQNSTAK